MTDFSLQLCLPSYPISPCDQHCSWPSVILWFHFQYSNINTITQINSSSKHYSYNRSLSCHFWLQSSIIIQCHVPERGSIILSKLKLKLLMTTIINVKRGEWCTEASLFSCCYDFTTCLSVWWQSRRGVQAEWTY